MPLQWPVLALQIRHLQLPRNVINLVGVLTLSHDRILIWLIDENLYRRLPISLLTTGLDHRVQLSHLKLMIS